MKWLLPLMMSLLLSWALSAQDEMVYTKAFTKKLQRSNLEFFHPVERWLQAAPTQSDDYMKYDLVLHSFPDVEARIKIDRVRKSRPLFPNVEITRLLADISTNDQEADIYIKKYDDGYAKPNYGADLAIYADFIPKETFSTFPKGRVLCLYKEDRALVSYIILYEDKLDPFFQMPIRFRVEDVK